MLKCQIDFSLHMDGNVYETARIWLLTKLNFIANESVIKYVQNFIHAMVESTKSESVILVHLLCCYFVCNGMCFIVHRVG